MRNLNVSSGYRINTPFYNAIKIFIAKRKKLSCVGVNFCQPSA